MTKAALLGRLCGQRVCKRARVNDSQYRQLMGKFLLDGKISDDEAKQLYEHGSVSPWKSGLMGGAGTSMLSALMTHIVNKGEAPETTGRAALAGLGFGGLMSGFSQAAENRKLRKELGL